MLFFGGDINVSNLRIAVDPCQLGNGPRILRLCSDLVSREGSDDRAQVGFPVVPHPLRFALLRAWLQHCDKEHDGCKRSDNKPTRPATFLHVVDSENLRLISGHKIGAEKYIALSHCWGKLEPGTVPGYCTTIRNISDRKTGFKIADLPQTLQDAIEVARELKVHYLWIDSLCIQQGPGGDWKDQAKRMEDVYSSAYCTLAATSAVDSNAGFLKRDASSIYLQDGSGRHVFVSTDRCDFDEEVEQATLNTRAWVMQERLLSCRTIHFGARHMYFECGRGVYCEDMTRLTCSYATKNFFKLDPKFPGGLRTSGFRSTISFLQSFLEDYSKRGLTEPTDRAVAISGLAQRIERVLSCQARYGVFKYFLHRNLLWQRSDLEKTERIEYKESDKVPSWSWMAYPGGIKFIEFDEVDYSRLDLFNKLKFDQEDERALITDIWTFRDCHLNREERADTGPYEVLDSGETVRGWAMYDVKHGEGFDNERAVVIGRTGYETSPERQEYHILVVRLKAGSKAENEYERVGIGRVQMGYLSWRQSDIRVI
ncbi:hypothetical protein FOVG_18055 [Fusarium oxysporum f. sp. pisi HDV247]|uniref:Heterokaryon incompatibility domain-containing protein n=1 Tax=Fusarium oxysporum f. sp. pisi HDV247 TaxID=1080344 RepID=W9NCS4_FUSOX|nr:hypothetical protein FOVG_18055 [Fusarium oxysporum f. sp. pisi HDV247]